jgi:hypothetical protein
MRTSSLRATLLTLWLCGTAPVAAADDPPAPEKKPAPEASPVRLELRLSATEKGDAPKGTFASVFVKEGSTFFAAEGDTLYVQRGGGGGGFGGGAGVGLNPAALNNQLTANYKEYLGVWDLTARKKAKEIAGCQSAALSPGGKTLGMVGSFKNKRQARLVNPKTGQTVQETDLTKLANAWAGFGVPNPIFAGSVQFTPDGKRLALQTFTDTWFWDFKSNKLTGGKAPFQTLVGFLPDGKAAVGMSGAVAIGGFGLAPGVPPGAAPVKEGEGKFVVCDIATGKVLRGFGEPTLHRGVLSADGKALAAFARSGGGLLGGFGGLGAVPPPAVNPNDTARIQLFDVASGKPTVTCDTQIVPKMATYQVNNGGIGIAGGVQDVAFTADGAVLASALATEKVGYLQLWDARTGKELLKVEVPFCPQAVALSRDGTRLAATGGLGPFELRVWDVLGLDRATSQAAPRPGD